MQPFTTMPAGALIQMGSQNTQLVREACTPSVLPTRRLLPDFGGIPPCSLLSRYQWFPIVVLIFISLMTNDVEHLFKCLLTIYIFSLEECLFKSFAHLPMCSASISTTPLCNICYYLLVSCPRHCCQIKTFIIPCKIHFLSFIFSEFIFLPGSLPHLSLSFSILGRLQWHIQN